MEKMPLTHCDFTYEEYKNVETNIQTRGYRTNSVATILEWIFDKYFPLNAKSEKIWFTYSSYVIYRFQTTWGWRALGHENLKYVFLKNVVDPM